MRIGIYGGTFNPPHLGHMASARAAVEVLELDKLLFIPAAIPPHKPLPEGSASPDDRLAMTSLMADGLGDELGRPGDVSVLDMELRREGKSYTADTLAALHAQYPEDEFYLLMGSDMFLTLQDWHEPQRVLDLAIAAVFAREETDSPDTLEAQAKRLRKDFRARTAFVPLPQITVLSSTQIRDQVKEESLWPQVYGYILRKGLYGVKKDLKHLSDADLRAASYSMVYPPRIRHVQGTEDTAAALAERWGANVEKARRAAILHDCTKYLSAEEQLALCAQYGEQPDALERRTVKLLHAKTGAWFARETFGVDDEIFGAIYWHTTGRPNMTLLEKILYLADYIEPNREFQGVDEMRALSVRDLDAALLLGFEIGIQEMAERGMEVHPRTVAARAYIDQKGTTK